MRPDPAILLDELAELANDCWEAYGQAAEWAGPEDLKHLFETLGQRRRHMAEAFEDQVRAMGHQPRDRDTSKATALRLVARLKATLVHERPRALVEECERADNALATRLREAETRTLPGGARDLPRLFHAEVVAALGQLAAVRVKMRG